MVTCTLTLLQQAGCHALGERYHPVTFTEIQHGHVKSNAEHEDLDIRLIEDPETWKLVWDAWLGGEPPFVDFDQHMILALRQGGPFSLAFDEVSKNGKRDLKVQTQSEFMAVIPDRYRLLRIPKMDIQSINGEPISRLQ